MSTALFHAFEPGPIRRALQISRHINSSPPRKMSSPSWDRLVRYISARDGSIRYGDPVVPDAKADIDALARAGKLEVKVLEGKVKEAGLYGLEGTGERDVVGTLLGPLTPRDVPIVRCVGLNYMHHIKETGSEIPKNPTVFTKPGPAVANPREAIPIPKIAQNACDYEGELTVVIGRDCKNVSEEEALDYVAGYAAGNDVSCRDWQMEKDKAGAPAQWSFSKSFDKYCPLGPCITSAKLLGDGGGLEMKVYVNGELRQEANTSDLCFGVRKLVSHLSTGQTLQAGSLIMTGTPGGVGLGHKPPKFLKDGDEVIVNIEGIGKLVNTVRFE